MLDPRLMPVAVSIVAEAAASVRAWRLRAYPWFFAYCIATLAQDGAAWIAWPPSSATYRNVWFAGTWIRLGLQVAILAEAAVLLKSRYKGVEKVLPRLAMSVAAAGLGFALVGTLDLWRAVPGKFYVLYFLVRYSGPLFIVFSAALAAWAWLFPSGVPGNLGRHATLLGLYFCTSSVIQYVLSWWRLDYLAVYNTAGIFLLWALTMRPSVEVPSAIQAAPPPDETARGLFDLTGEVFRRARSGR